MHKFSFSRLGVTAVDSRVLFVRRAEIYLEIQVSVATEIFCGS